MAYFKNKTWRWLPQISIATFVKTCKTTVQTNNLIRRNYNKSTVNVEH